MSNEASEFKEWLKREKAQGLVDIKFFSGDLSEATLGSFLRELNVMNQAEFTPQEGYADDQVERLNYSHMRNP